MNFERLPCGCPIDSGCTSYHDSAFSVFGTGADEVRYDDESEDWEA